MEKKLQAYFDASLHGLSSYSHFYQAIIRHLEKNNCRVNQMVFKATKKSFQPIKPEEGKKLYKNILKLINKSDFVVSDLTYGSPGVTMVIQDAIHRFKKPILVLYHESKKGRLSVPFIGNPSRLLNVQRYSLKNLNLIIKEFTKKVKSQIPSSRFTIRLDEELDKYIEYTKLKLGETSKNQTILNILQERKHMDEDYQKFLTENHLED